MGIFAMLNQSYFGGLVIYSTHLFQEGDTINILDEEIYEGKVISIDLMRTKIKLPQTTIIRSIPNKRFLSISIEKNL